MNFQHRNRVEKCVYALLLCGAFLSFLLNFSFEIIVKDSAAAVAKSKWDCEYKFIGYLLMSNILMKLPIRMFILSPFVSLWGRRSECELCVRDTTTFTAAAQNPCRWAQELFAPTYRKVSVDCKLKLFSVWQPEQRTPKWEVFEVNFYIWKIYISGIKRHNRQSGKSHKHRMHSKKRSKQFASSWDDTKFNL